MNPYTLALLFFAFCTFFISLLIWLKRQDAVGKIYFVFSLFVAFWAIGVSFELNNDVPYQTALIAVRLGNMSAVVFTVIWLHFSLVFTDRLEKYRKILRFFYGLAAFICCFGFSRYFIPHLAPALSFRHYVRLGVIYHLFTVMFFTAVPLAFFQLFQKLKLLKGAERLRLKGFIIATLTGFLGGTVTFLPGYEIMVPQYGLFMLPIYPFVMAYFMTRQQLFDIEELAKAAHREKLAAIGTLATSINHEIRNPLYIIQGLAQSYLSNLEERIFQNNEQALQKSAEISRKMEEQASRAVDIMKRFSTFAKQQVQNQPEIGAASLNEALETVLPLVRHELELEKIEIKVNIPDQFPNLKADSRHLEQILFNLVINACQAMKEEEMVGEISINAEQQNGHVNILVKDTGPGIPTDKLKQVFEPFYTTKEQGTGLGLYITKQFVERNGGTISVQSILNKETTFKLQFEKALAQC